MPLMEISVVPVGTKSAFISKFVVSSERPLIRNGCFKSEITSMGTLKEVT